MARDHHERHPRDDRDRQHRRRGHRATDSTGELLPRASRAPPTSGEYSASESPSPRKQRASRASSSNPLSVEGLAALDKINHKKGYKGYEYDENYIKEVREKEAKLERERVREEKEVRRKEREAEKGADKERRRAYESDAAREKERRRAYESDDVRDKERRKESRRAYESGGGRDKERSKERSKERRRAYESDGGVEAGRRVKGERKREKSRVLTDDEAVDKRRSRTDHERVDKRRSHTDDERDGRKRHLTDEERKERRRQYEERYTPSERAERKSRKEKEDQRGSPKKRRVISGPLLEEGGNDEDYDIVAEKRGGGGGGGSSDGYTDEDLARKKKRKKIFIIIGISLLLLAIIIPVAVVLSRKKGSTTVESKATENSNKPSNTNLDGMSEDDIPKAAQGTILDPFTWYDTFDFNVTYTEETIGGLTVMGLNSTWDDEVQANDNVPKLSDSFAYGTKPIRGINVGGWLNLEPFITPSFFESFSTRDGVRDEYTLCTKLGITKCTTSLEEHYSAFVRRQTFEDIRAAGFDHVRIPFGYWAVTTYEGDPYVPKIAWRYLLRGIEYARQNGLRVNLDLHGAPGSQNGWNHSGRQGVIGWLNGTDGDLNAQRTLDIHGQLSTFFSQPRYKNVVTVYGIVNEPRMVDLNTDSVLAWTTKAINVIRKNNITAVLVFGDGFMGLDKWQGKLQHDDALVLDVHQYVIFNNDQIKLKHTDKLNFACKGWTAQTLRSQDKSTGFGPTMCGEWSQADTDCTQYINNVGIGSRWEGNMNTGNASTSVLDPTCPTDNNPTCDCTNAIADPSEYSDAYKKWLYQFAVAQMESFEKGFGWFYWTWETEKATQWSWKLGMAAGILPQKVWERSFSCNDTLEDFGQLGLPENY